MSNCNCGCNNYINPGNYPEGYQQNPICPPRPCPPRPCPPRPCPPGPWPPVGPTGPIGPTGPVAPFLSSYAEASGAAQAVANGANIVFDTSAGNLDIVGTDISLDAATGTVFTLNRPGLYMVEWSLNFSSTESPILVGLMENGGGASVLSNFAQIGSHSSGALIHVAQGETPYTISLHNFGPLLQLQDPQRIGNTAASMRIIRIADGPVTP